MQDSALRESYAKQIVENQIRRKPMGQQRTGSLAGIKSMRTATISSERDISNDWPPKSSDRPKEGVEIY